MKKYTIKRYEFKDYKNWNAFIDKAKNATFLFHRDFMEDHKDRFEDYSLIVLDGDKWIAVLPANRVGNTVHSHQGLSYGTIIVLDSIRIKEYLEIFWTLMKELNESKIELINFKLVPKIYNKTIADEIDYASFLMKSQTYRSDVYLVIDMKEKYKPNRNRMRALKVANSLGIEIRQENDYFSFWNEILIPNLNNRFNVNPVHTVDEITKLAASFPEEIKLFNAYLKGVLKAGVVLFLFKDVVHFQYSSGSDDRMDTAALDILFDFVIKKYSNKQYISFGSSSENEGLSLNEGLAYWKESFGAKNHVQNFIKIETKNFTELNNIVK